MLHAILDQLKKLNHEITRQIQTPQDLRAFICSKLMEQIRENKIFWVQSYSPETWLKNMEKDRYWCDDVFLLIAANVFNRDVILIPLSPSSAHRAGMYLE